MNVPHHHPLIVMSFNRPRYLEAVLRSLRAQVGADIEQRRVALFQDGGHNKFSGKTWADQADLDGCVDVFRDIFPAGEVFQADENLGIALNFDRAEKYVFEKLQSKVAIFLEDDLVLSPHYLNILDHLVDVHRDDERVGYLAAYGEHSVPFDAQARNRNMVTTLHHNWGFALFRRQWNLIRPYLDQYMPFVVGRDYRDRDVAGIERLFSSWGFAASATSQDAAKTIACCATGTIKLNTVACFAKYIGETGLHMNPNDFEQRNYANTRVLDELVTDFGKVGGQLYANIRTEMMRWAGVEVVPPLRDDVEEPKTTAAIAAQPTEDESDPVVLANRAAAALFEFSDGTNRARAAEQQLHAACADMRAGNADHASRRAAASLVTLFEGARNYRDVRAVFLPMADIRDVANDSHVRFDLRANVLRIICPRELLSAHMTDYFEAFVLASSLLKAAISGRPLEAGFTMDLGNGSNSGQYRRIAFSSALPQADLIVDPGFFFTNGYATFSQTCEQNWVSWRERNETVFWRGETTGIQTSTIETFPIESWAWLQRLHLCDAARRSDQAERLDFGITRVVQIPSEPLAAAIIDAGFLRDPPLDRDLMSSRYTCVVDGNSSLDNGLIKALISGSCVLLIDSQFGFRSWYYDRLVAGQTHIPVRADLADLDDQIAWALDNPDRCEKIAANGAKLAETMSFALECRRSVEQIKYFLQT